MDMKFENRLFLNQQTLYNYNPCNPCNPWLMTAFFGSAPVHHHIPVKQVKAAFVVADQFQFFIQRAGSAFLFHLFVDIPLQEVMRGIILSVSER